MNTPHKFMDTYTNQWAQNGGRPYTQFVCKKCGVSFTHYYHDVPDIFTAIKHAGIGIDKCDAEGAKNAI